MQTETFSLVQLFEELTEENISQNSIYGVFWTLAFHNHAYVCVDGEMYHVKWTGKIDQYTVTEVS
jgi:hypothetical protein